MAGKQPLNYLRLTDACHGLFADVEAYKAWKSALSSRIHTKLQLPQHLLAETGLSKEQAGALERWMGSNDLLDVNYLSRGMAAAATVARVNGYDPNTHRTFSASGFMVAPRLFMTNRHVFPDSDVARQSEIEFGYELDDNKRERQTEKYRLVPEEGFLVGDSEDLDFALVAVAPTSQSGVPLANWGHLQLDGRPGKVSEGQFITVIQHPSGGLKQVALRENQLIRKGPSTLLYRSDTAPGSSGSPCFNDAWQVVAIHSQGVPKEGPGGKVALRNGRLVDASDLDKGLVGEDEVVWEANRGVRISTIVNAVRSMSARDPSTAGDLISAFLEGAKGELNPQPLPPGHPQAIAPTGPQLSGSTAVNWRHNLRSAVMAPGVPHTHTVEKQRSQRRPRRNSDDAGESGWAFADSDGGALSDRAGYDPKFLGRRVMLPVLSSWAAESFGNPFVLPLAGSTEIKYTHFSVVFNEQRRLAFFSAVNIDGANTVKVKYGGKFRLDPRVPPELQCGEWLYADNVLDRGHVTRRNDAVWGDLAQRANTDTFYFTNIAPQHKDFNQGKELWQGLENFVLDNAKGERVRASVFSGPIFRSDDRVYRGVPIPQEFFKVVVVADTERQLRSSAYIVSQQALVKVGGDLPDEAMHRPSLLQEVLPVGPFRTFQVALSEVEELTGLLWDDVVKESEVYGRAAAAALGEATATVPARHELRSFADILM